MLAVVVAVGTLVHLGALAVLVAAEQERLV
jgi:hypothetical protein